jgi:hypothetical protein
MPLTTKELRQMPLESLIDLATQIKNEIHVRREEVEKAYDEINEILVESNELKFEFYAETNEQYNKRYVARLRGTSKDYGFKREFYDINITRNKDSDLVIYSGSYNVKESDIIEIKEGSIIKEYYIVHNCELKFLCTEQEVKIVALIKRYLDKAITKSKLLARADIWEEDSYEVLDELKD